MTPHVASPKAMDESQRVGQCLAGYASILYSKFVPGLRGFLSNHPHRMVSLAL